MGFVDNSKLCRDAAAAASLPAAWVEKSRDGPMRRVEPGGLWEICSVMITHHIAKADVTSIHRVRKPERNARFVTRSILIIDIPFLPKR